MTGILLSPKSTTLVDRCPSCNKDLAITIRQNPSYMGFDVVIEEIKEAEDEIN